MPSLILITEGIERQVFPLGKATLMVGRSDDSEIQLPSDSVSREHASIVFDRGQFVLRDNGSTNGSYVNGVKVSHQVLQDHDVLRFGEYLFIVDLRDHCVSRDAEGGVQLRAGDAKITGEGSNYRAVVRIATSKPVASSVPQVAPKRALTLTLTEPVALTPKVVNATASQEADFSQVAFICGVAGVVAFFPAIVFGHLSFPANERLRRLRNLGIGLGYAWLAVWIIALTWWFQRPASGVSAPSIQTSQGVSIARSASKPVSLDSPTVLSGLSMLQDQPVTWMPSTDYVDAMLSPASGPELFSLPMTTEPGQDRLTALQEFRAAWKHGVILYEPTILRYEKDAKSAAVQMILEDVTTNPTFQEFNSTIVPAKKPVLGPFYVPGLDNNLFYRQNSRFASKIPKFNEERFTWRMAERGVRWVPEGRFDLRHDLPQLRWICVLHAASGRAPLVIHTLEGDLLRDTPKEYTLPLYPAEILAEIFYMAGSHMIVAMRFNENLFHPDEARVARSLIDANFKTILARRPTSEAEIPAAFRLKSKSEKPDVVKSSSKK